MPFAALLASAMAPTPTPAPAPVDPNKAIRIARFFSYPKQVLYLLASVIFLVSLLHYLTLAHRYFTRRRIYPERKATDATHVSLARLPAAIGDSLRALAFRWTVPLGLGYTLNLAEVGLTLGYIGVLFSWTFVNTTNLQGMIADPKYFANRAGTIAASQVPIMVALGTRNNLVSWLTGVSFDKLNYLHRLSARVICILAWIHGGGRITVGLTTDETINHRWVQCGPLAVSSLTLLCILSVRPARERAYELFLAIHLLFALIFILGMLFHLTGRTLTYYGAWPAFIVWGIDRFIRVVQLVLYNTAYFLPSTKSTNNNNNNNNNNPTSAQALDAEVTLLTPHFLRIALRRPALHWRAGQSAFLSFPALSAQGGWALESHPFTIATLDSSSANHTTAQKQNQEGKELVFILRVRRGFTQRLAGTLAGGGGAHAQRHKVLVSGPYSAPPLLVGYQRVVLLAGGSGVAFTVPLLLDVIRRARKGERGCAHVLFVWAVRDIEHITWIQDILTPALTSASLPSSLSLSIQFYITSSPSTTASSTSSSSSIADIDPDADPEKWADSDSTSNSNSNSAEATGSKPPTGGADPTPLSTEKTASTTLLALPFVRVERGRPDVEALLQREIAAATGRVSVNVCGTHGLAESVRVALRTPRPMDVLRGGPTVTLHVEAFGGA